MLAFSNDADILKYEPVLFGELHIPNQVLASGTDATLGGTTFTDPDADFVAAQVSDGCVVYLRSEDGSLDGEYEIVSVDSATQLTVSVIRPDAEDSPIAPKPATDVFYRICSYKPQAAEVALELTEHFGIDTDTQDILNKDVLRTASVFAVLSSLYAMLAGTSSNESFWNKSLHYKKLFEKHRERCRLAIDANSDGIADITRPGSSFKFVRD